MHEVMAFIAHLAQRRMLSDPTRTAAAMRVAVVGLKALCGEWQDEIIAADRILTRASTRSDDVAADYAKIARVVSVYAPGAADPVGAGGVARAFLMTVDDAAFRRTEAVDIEKILALYHARRLALSGAVTDLVRIARALGTTKTEERQAVQDRVTKAIRRRALPAR